MAAAILSGLASLPCLAQSADGASASVYGLIDTGVRHINDVSAAGGVTQMASGLNTSRFGIRASEAIDGELHAGLRLEGGFNSGTGAQSNSAALFDRTAALDLGGRQWDLKAGRQEGFGYELAATGVTDPLAMALNLPDYASPAAAGSKAPVLGANPLQALYSYTYGQLRYNNSLRVTANDAFWTAGIMVAAGGVAGSFAANTLRSGHLGASVGALRLQSLFQQAVDAHGVHSSLTVLSATYTIEAWKLQAGVHDLRLGAGFDSTGLGNGASGTGILGSSTTVSPVLAGTHQDFRFTVADLGATWAATRAVPLTLAAYKTRSDGSGQGDSIALVALGKWFVLPRTALYAEVDHATQSGRLAGKTVGPGNSAVAYMVGMNLRF